MSILINIAMITGTIEDLKPINLLPLMDRGLLSDITGSVYIFGDIAMAVLAVGFIYPMLNKKKKVFGITFWSMITAACMVIIWPICEIMVMGPELMEQYVVVCMQQIRCALLACLYSRRPCFIVPSTA